MAHGAVNPRREFVCLGPCRRPSHERSKLTIIHHIPHGWQRQSIGVIVVVNLLHTGKIVAFWIPVPILVHMKDRCWLQKDV
jgi:hypothetical protein